MDAVFVDEAHRKRGQGINGSVRVLEIPSSDKTLSTSGAKGKPLKPLKPLKTHQGSDTAYFFHTSGTSSGLPKPIAQSHAGVVGALPRFAAGEHVATFSTTPLYHGGLADCLRAWTSGAMIWCFPEGLAPVTTANLLSAVAYARAASPVPVAYFSSVPFVLQRLADEDRGVELLRSMDLVGVGGAPLAASVGDGLVRAGVKLLSRMGSAECGFLMSSHRDYSTDGEWQYLRPVDDARLLEFEPRENGLCELVVKPGWPFMSKTNRDDGSYATSDLFEPHPSRPNAWRYHSRADAQIMLVNGKKFDPSPIEADVLASTKLLQDVLIFGSGRDYPGILLFPADDKLSPGGLIDAVWPCVEKVNSATQSHARLPRSMLVVVPVSAQGAEKALEKSSKGTILRRQAEERYADAIEAAYQGPLTMPSSWRQIEDEHLSSAVLDCFHRVLGRQVDAHEDLYRQGVDSMACIQVRNLIEATCLPPLGERRLPANVIYDRGTVEALTAYLRRVRSDDGRARDGEDDGDDDGAAHKAMYGLAEKYSNFGGADVAAPAPRGKHGTVVVLTGATGFLGSYMLHQLRQETGVRAVYCLVRSQSPHEAHDRVSAALAKRGMPGLEQPGGKVACLPCDLTDAQRLGLAERDWRRILEDATVVVHAAWTVNFSLRLGSFADQVAGTRNLIGLAMACGARFFFLSSTAAVSRAGAPAIAERASSDASEASPLGYSRSKWVAERVCAAAGNHGAGGSDVSADRRRRSVFIIRIGQLCGDEAGTWNASEAHPLMLATARIAGCLPDLPGEALDWMPVELAARAVLEIALPDGNVTPDEHGASQADAGTGVYHVLNPHAVPTWSQMLNWISTADGLDEASRPFDIVPPEAWLSRLEDAFKEGDARHPAQALLGLWKSELGTGHGGGGAEARPKPVFEVGLTRRVSATMWGMRPLDRQRVLAMWRWVGASIPGL